MLSQGLNEQQALKNAKQSITSVGGLIEGNKKVELYSMRRELLQWALIYLITACIVAVPMLMVRIGTPLSTLLFLTTIVVGIIYARSGAKAHRHDRTGYVSYSHYRKLSKLVWIFWAIFALVYCTATTGMYFGSNIWFSRKVSIDGPYELAVLIILYSFPFFTLVLPLVFQKVPALILKYEVGNDEEEK